LKWYIRELVNSRTYQIASTGEATAARPEWFQRARSRPLSLEELVASWRVATWYVQADSEAEEKIEKGRYYPLTSGYVLRFFGKPTTGTGDFAGGLQEHLYFNNGNLGKIAGTREGGLIHALAGSDAPLEERIDTMFLAALTRYPSPEERKRFVEYLSVEDDLRSRMQEAVWVLLTSSEFRFNH